MDNIRVKIHNITGFIIDEDFGEERAPIIGIYSAFKELAALNYKFGFTLSCDNPFLNTEVIKLLINGIENFDCIIPRWNNNFLEPLFAIYPIKKAFKIAEFSILKKRFKLVYLLDKDWKINYISIEKSIQPIDKKLTTFLNLNNFHDLEKANHKFEKIKK